MISTPTETEDLRLINYTKYSAVIFDCFGTILNIKHKKNPYYHYLKDKELEMLISIIL